MDGQGILTHLSPSNDHSKMTPTCTMTTLTKISKTRVIFLWLMTPLDILRKCYSGHEKMSSDMQRMFHQKVKSPPKISELNLFSAKKQHYDESIINANFNL